MGPQQQCGICKSAASKYKCPTCLAPYCSLICFKDHKAVPCSKAEEQHDPAAAAAAAAAVETQQQPPRDFEAEDATGSRLRRGQLEAIAASEDIRNMLKDEELQRIVRRIDASVSAEQDLDIAMDMPAFKEFTDKLLAIVDSEEKSIVTV